MNIIPTKASEKIEKNNKEIPNSLKFGKRDRVFENDDCQLPALQSGGEATCGPDTVASVRVTQEEPEGLSPQTLGRPDCRHSGAPISARFSEPTSSHSCDVPEHSLFYEWGSPWD